MRKLIAASLLIAILSLAVSIFGQIQYYKFTDNKVVVAGAIRSIDEKGWFVIKDEFHTPINLGRIEIVKGFIVIHFTFTASAIHSLTATPDETFAKNGYFVGAKVTRNFVAIQISRVHNGKVEKVDPHKIRSQYGNIWIHGLFSVDD